MEVANRVCEEVNKNCSADDLTLRFNLHTGNQSEVESIHNLGVTNIGTTDIG